MGGTRGQREAWPNEPQERERERRDKARGKAGIKARPAVKSGASFAINIQAANEATFTPGLDARRPPLKTGHKKRVREKIH